MGGSILICFSMVAFSFPVCEWASNRFLLWISQLAALADSHIPRNHRRVNQPACNSPEPSPKLINKLFALKMFGPCARQLPWRCHEHGFRRSPHVSISHFRRCSGISPRADRTTCSSELFCNHRTTSLARRASSPVKSPVLRGRIRASSPALGRLGAESGGTCVTRRPRLPTGIPWRVGMGGNSQVVSLTGTSTLSCLPCSK